MPVEIVIRTCGSDHVLRFGVCERLFVHPRPMRSCAVNGMWGWEMDGMGGMGKGGVLKPGEHANRECEKCS